MVDTVKSCERVHHELTDRIASLYHLLGRCDELKQRAAGLLEPPTQPAAEAPAAGPPGAAPREQMRVPQPAELHGAPSSTRSAGRPSILAAGCSEQRQRPQLSARAPVPPANGSRSNLQSWQARQLQQQQQQGDRAATGPTVRRPAKRRRLRPSVDELPAVASAQEDPPLAAPMGDSSPWSGNDSSSSSHGSEEEEEEEEEVLPLAQRLRLVRQRQQLQQGELHPAALPAAPDAPLGPPVTLTTAARAPSSADRRAQGNHELSRTAAELEQQAEVQEELPQQQQVQQQIHQLAAEVQAHRARQASPEAVALAGSSSEEEEEEATTVAAPSPLPAEPSTAVTPSPMPAEPITTAVQQGTQEQQPAGAAPAAGAEVRHGEAATVRPPALRAAPTAVGRAGGAVPVGMAGPAGATPAAAAATPHAATPAAAAPALAGDACEVDLRDSSSSGEEAEALAQRVQRLRRAAAAPWARPAPAKRARDADAVTEEGQGQEAKHQRRAEGEGPAGSGGPAAQAAAPPAPRQRLRLRRWGIQTEEEPGAAGPEPQPQAGRASRVGSEQQVQYQGQRASSPGVVVVSMKPPRRAAAQGAAAPAERGRGSTAGGVPLVEQQSAGSGNRVEELAVSDGDGDSDPKESGPGDNVPEGAPGREGGHGFGVPAAEGCPFSLQETARLFQQGFTRMSAHKLRAMTSQAAVERKARQLMQEAEKANAKEKQRREEAWKTAAMAWREKNRPPDDVLEAKRREETARVAKSIASARRRPPLHHVAPATVAEAFLSGNGAPAGDPPSLGRRLHRARGGAKGSAPVEPPEEGAPEADWRSYHRRASQAKVQHATSFEQVLRAFGLPCDPGRLKEAYRQATRMYHPDSNSKDRLWKTPADKVHCEEVMKIINERKPDDL